jgi:hypothetical protein
MKTCKGVIDPFTCDYCHKEFTHCRSKYIHYKSCKTKREIDSKALTVIDHPTQQLSTPTTVVNQGDIELQQNIQQQNVHNIQSQQNIQTQQNNVIVVYNPGNTDFKVDHLLTEDLQKIIRLAIPTPNNQAVTEYSKQIFANPENRCIKKKDLKQGHSEVHIGNNQWEMHLDKNLYPQLANDIANKLSDYLYTKQEQIREDQFMELLRFVDYMADGGYINTDDANKEKFIQREYTNYVKGLKLAVHDATVK